LRARVVKFAELANDALGYCRANNLGQQFDAYRIGRLVDEFGPRPAELPIDDLRRWFTEQEWKPATFNRYKSMLSLIYRLGIEHGKITSNPAKLLKRKQEDNGRGFWASIRQKKSPSYELQSRRPRLSQAGP
jgi:hypothetical protein